VTQIGRPSPTSRVNTLLGSVAEGLRIGPNHRRSGLPVRAGPPVQMYLQSWMQLDVWPDGSATNSPICFRFDGSAYEMT
jgi:hypothetical protein